MPIRHHTVQGEDVRLVVLPRYNEMALAAWQAFTESDNIFGLDVETTAPPAFEGAHKLFGPAIALAEYRVPSDVSAAYVKRGFAPGSKQRVGVRAIQFGSKTEGWVFDSAGPDWEPHVRALLLDVSKRFVSHNAAFDTTRVLHRYGIRLGLRSIDTLPMAGMVWPGRTAPTEGRSKGLKEVSAWGLDDDGLVRAEHALHCLFADIYPRSVSLPKSFEPGVGPCRNCNDEVSLATSLRGFGPACYDAAVGITQQVEEWGWTNVPLGHPVFTAYAGLDAVYVRRVLDWLASEIRRRGMSALSKDEQRVKRMMVHRTNRGMKVDVDWTENTLAELRGENEAAGIEVIDRTGVRTPRSPVLKVWLAEHGCRTKSLDKAHRPGLLLTHEDDEEVGPVLRAYDQFMGNVNLISNLETILRHAEGGNGCAHPTINTLQAHTARMSVTGPAMQTFKKTDPRLRGCFVARGGHVFVGADWDNQETRIAAAISGDPALNRIVAENLNQHLLTAESIFGNAGWIGKAETPKLYTYAKNLDFAQQYGAMPKKIAAMIGVSEPDARAMWLAWRETYRGLVEWIEWIATLPYIRNPFGRIIPTDEYGRAFANGNYYIQSTGRDLLGKAMCNLADSGWGSSIWLPVHDEIILEVPEERAIDAAQALSEAMTMYLPNTHGDVKVNVIIPATGEVIGNRWRGLA